MINQNWVFGNKAGITFNGNPSPSPFQVPTATGHPDFYTNEGCASVSDENGILLFYTDGVYVWKGVDGKLVEAPNSTPYKLKGDYTATQSCIIVPDPANKEQYYILTMDGNSYNPNIHGLGQNIQNGPIGLINNFAAYLINVNSWLIDDLTSNLGTPQTYSNDTYTNGNTTFNLSPAEKLVAVRMPNCSDFWILSVEQLLENGDSGEYVGNHPNEKPGYEKPKLALMRIYQIKKNGVTSSISHVRDVELGEDAKLGDVGSMRCSSNCKWVAIASRDAECVYLYEFDHVSGILNVNSRQTIQLNGKFGDRPYGVEFSGNSEILYVSTIKTGSNGTIYQIEMPTSLNSNAVISNEFQITRLSGTGVEFSSVGAVQMGPDDKIYIARAGTNKLGVINNPNVLGVGCDLESAKITLDGICLHGLPNLVSTRCPDDDCNCDCNHDCTGCNEDAEAQNEELIERAKLKHNTIKAEDACPDPFLEACTLNAVTSSLSDLQPCFYFHWGDGANDQIEEHDTEVFYLTACNNFNDIRFNGLRITKVTLLPDVHPLEKIHIVPDRFVNLDCLEPCSCQTREFAMITRANDTAGAYTLQVEYCYEGISIIGGKHQGMAEFPLIITED